MDARAAPVSADRGGRQGAGGPPAGGRSVRRPGASAEIQLREQGELGRLLASAEGYLVLDEEGRRCGRLDHVRYERHADYPDEIVVRRGFRQRRVLPFEAVAAVDRKNETVLLRIKP